MLGPRRRLVAAAGSGGESGRGWRDLLSEPCVLSLEGFDLPLKVREEEQDRGVGAHQTFT